MITLNNSMCGATANFPESVQATLNSEIVVFDYTPGAAGEFGPGPFCEGYLPRDGQYAGMYEIFADMPDFWTFYDGMDWWSDCTLVNGVDGAGGFTFHGIAFLPETMPVVRAGSCSRPSSRQQEQALTRAVMLAPEPDRSRTASVVRLTVDKPIHRASAVARFAGLQPVLTGFGNPTLDAMQASLICCWKLEETGGKRVDAISGENLSAHNAPGNALGRNGFACAFSNSASHGLYREQSLLGPLGAHEADTEIAFSTWIYANTLGYRSIAGFIDEMGGMGPWTVSLGYENRIYLNINTYNGGDYASAQTGSLSANQWYNVVFTYASNGHVRLYLNGGLVATGDTNSGTGGLAQPYSPFTLGCAQLYDFEHDTYSYGNSWDGLIDETCVWNAVPADPDAFAAALWNGGQGAFHRVDSTRRMKTGGLLAARQAMRAFRHERLSAVALLAVAGTATRFDAVADHMAALFGARPSARTTVRQTRPDAFDSIFGLNPVRAIMAHRAGVRRISRASALSSAHGAARQSRLARASICLDAIAELVATASCSRFDAVAYRHYLVTRHRPVARRQAVASTLGRFDMLFGLDPTRANSAMRQAARWTGGTRFGHPALDALAEHLVCCWKLEEDTGKRIDAISGEDLTPHNDPTNTPGKDGFANLFSNTTANGLYREVADLGPLGQHGAGAELTVSVWLYANSFGYRSIAGFIDDMGAMGPWSLSLGYENRLYVNIATPEWDNAYVQSDSLTLGQWYNVVFAYSNDGTVRLYLNGVLAGTGSTYSGSGGLAQPYSPFTIGCGQIYDHEHDTWEFGNSWDGLIDETCVWCAVPENPDLFAATLWDAGRGNFLYIDPRQHAVAAARGNLRAMAAEGTAARMLADQELARSASPTRARALRYTVETNTGVWADARGQAAVVRAARADAEYIVALTKIISAARTRVRRDLDVLNCARSVLGLDARATTTAAGAAFMKALAVCLHTDHGVRLGAGTKATFAASADVFDMRATNRVTTGEHPGARHSLAWTIPHLTSARDKTGNRIPILYLARARQDALHRLRLTLRAPQAAAGQVRHSALTETGWRLLARNASTGEVLDLGFVPAGTGGTGGALVDVALPDGDWRIEPRPAEWFWNDCRGRASTSVSIRDGLILHAGLPAILNLRGEIINQRRAVRWEVAGELLPGTFQFGIWTAEASPVDTTGQPVAAIPFSSGRGSYLYAFSQTAPIHLVVAAFDAGSMGPEAEIFLDWATAPPASPVNQLAR